LGRMVRRLGARKKKASQHRFGRGGRKGKLVVTNEGQVRVRSGKLLIVPTHEWGERCMTTLLRQKKEAVDLPASAGKGLKQPEESQSKR